MEQPPPISEAEAPTPKPPPMSLMARLMNIFAAPGEVFDDIKNSPANVSNWFVPMLLLLVISWTGTGIILSQEAFRHQISELADKSVEKQIEKFHMTEQQAEMQRKGAQIGWKINAVAGPAIVACVTPFCWGFFIWLVGRAAFKAKNLRYMKAVEVVGLASAISILEVVLKTLLILVTGNILASTSLAVFLKEFNPQNPIHGLLTIVNVMTFWVLAVRAIGLARVASASIGWAIAWVFGIWLSYTALFWGIGVAVQHIFAKK